MSLPDCKICDNSRHVIKKGKMERCACLKEQVLLRKLKRANIAPDIAEMDWEYFEKVLPGEKTKIKSFKNISNKLKEGVRMRKWILAYGKLSFRRDNLLSFLIARCLARGKEGWSGTISDIIEMQFDDKDFYKSISDFDIINLKLNMPKKHAMKAYSMERLYFHRRNMGLFTIFSFVGNLSMLKGEYGSFFQREKEEGRIIFVEFS